jgi:hypothetical protein
MLCSNCVDLYKYFFLFRTTFPLNENKSDYFFERRYLIFYSPFDIGYKFFKFLPIKIICSALKEVYR